MMACGCADEFVSPSKLPDESNNVMPPPATANHTPSIGPLTPDSIRENGEQHLSRSSPLSDGNSPQTPKHTLFDSFAPGPDKFMLAPRYRKYRDESRITVVRRLSFNLLRDTSPESNAEAISVEDHLFELVYGTVLDAIVSEQTDEPGVKFPISGLHGLRTPESTPHLTGIAETCPGAPVKSKNNYRNIDKEICKKLEF